MPEKIAHAPRGKRLDAGGPDPATLEHSLYAVREKIYPRQVHGWFATLRVASVAALLGVFYSVPWLSWDGRPLLLFDLPARKFHLFGLTLFPQDFLYLTFMLIVAAMALFFFTALAGRLWCGYACPQTVYTEVFLWIERKIEGDRRAQQRLDRRPWDARKARTKSLKHGIWIGFSLWTGFTFVGYFTPIGELGHGLASVSLGPWETFWILFYSLATYGNAGWMREQVCMYMCPYARFQSAMFDSDTLVISYDAKRGEPRGPRKRGTDLTAAGLGECVECTMCVQVCPTGIDIRDGLQYQCIACASCIDVCDSVMERVGYPTGLIRYTTENALTGQTPRLVRPRIVIYLGLIILLVLGLAYSLATRVPLGLDIIRDRNALFRDTADGRIENVYTLKLINMDNHAHAYRVAVQGIKDAELVAPEALFQVDPAAVRSVAVSVRARPDRLSSRSTPISFTLRAEDDPNLMVEEDARFLGPTPAPSN